MSSKFSDCDYKDTLLENEEESYDSPPSRPCSDIQCLCFFCGSRSSLQVGSDEDKNFTEIRLTGAPAPERYDDDVETDDEAVRLSLELLSHILTIDLPGLTNVIDIKSLWSCSICTSSLLNLRTIIGVFNHAKVQIEECLSKFQLESFSNILDEQEVEVAAEEELRRVFSRHGSIDGWIERLNKEILPSQLYHEVLFLPLRKVLPEGTESPVPSEILHSSYPGSPVIKEEDDGEFVFVPPDPLAPSPPSSPQPVAQNRRERLVKLLERKREAQFGPTSTTRFTKRRRDLAIKFFTDDNRKKIKVEKSLEKSTKDKSSSPCAVDRKYYYDNIEYLQYDTHWTCTACREEFSRSKHKQNLFKHIREVHSRNFKYPCPFCSSLFQFANRIRDHIISWHHPDRNPQAKEYIGTLKFKKRSIRNKNKKRLPSPEKSKPVPSSDDPTLNVFPEYFHYEGQGRHRVVKLNGKLYYDNVEYFESDTEFTCTICQGIFSKEFFTRSHTRAKFFEHICSHTGNFPYSCPFASEGCKQKFFYANRLRDHLLGLSHKNEGQEERARGFASNLKLKRRTPKRRIKESVSKKDNLLTMVHNNESELPSAQDFTANIGIQTQSHPQLAKVSLEEIAKKKTPKKKAPFKCRRLICATCGAQYRSRTALLVHESREHNPKMVTCDKCNKDFRGIHTLKAHQKSVHVTKSDYKCPQCPKLLETQSKLNVHMAQVHDKELRKLICPYPGCGRRFAIKSALDCHKSTHSDERNWFCSTCEMSFKCSNHLAKHVKGKRHLAKLANENALLG